MLQACYLHRVDFSLRFPCRVMLAYVSGFLLFRNTGYHQQVRTWERRLQHLFLASLQSFSTMMQRQFAVYALLHVDAETSGRGPWLQNKTFYVGNATTGIHLRQDARWRKHRCLEQGQFVNVELVMHYLHSRGLLHDVVIVPLFNLVNATDTRSTSYFNFSSHQTHYYSYELYYNIFQVMDDSETEASVRRYSAVLHDILYITFLWLGLSYDASSRGTTGF